MRKRDLGQIDTVARRLGMTEEERQDFGIWIEELKRSGERGTAPKGDFTFQEIENLGRQFIEERRGRAPQ